MGEIKRGPDALSGPVTGDSELGSLPDETLDDPTVNGAPEPGAIIAQKYQIERAIARGGMGAVYAATHLVSRKRVALKWMLPTTDRHGDARERFIREACATARIDHPNIVDIYDVGNDGSSVYLVMELLHGETLADRVAREDVPAHEAIGLLMPALRGVAAAHSHGVIHRDLKPDNIFLCRTQQGEPLEPKVLDFGISKFANEDSTDHSLTRSGAVLGTPYYMSPEQVRGAHEVDARTDVYAFGVMLYEMLTGERPFDAETYNQLILKIATETPPPIAELNPAIDPRLVSVVERAMAREPGRRYPSIEALAYALEPFAGGVRFRSGRAADASAASLEVPAAEPVPLPRLEGSLFEPGFPPLRAAEALAPPAAHRRARTTLASALIALVVCSGVFLWLRTRQRPELSHDDEATTTQRVAPPPAETAGAAPLEADQAAPEASETTANASTDRVAAEPATEPATASADSPQKSRATPPGATRKAALPTRSAARERRSDDEASVTTSALKRVSNDWDDRMSASPPRALGSAVSPAGRIDQHDFR